MASKECDCMLSYLQRDQWHWYKNSLQSLGYANITVRVMGGDSIVLTFESIEERDSMFNGGKMAWPMDWLLESYKWEESTIKPASCRLIWINFYGVLIQLWNLGNFNKLRNNKMYVFCCGKVLISSSQTDMINEVVESKGKLHQIRAIEEQLVINTFLRTNCSCPGCNVKEMKHNEREEDGDVDEVDDEENCRKEGDNELSQPDAVAETAGSKVEELAVDIVEEVADSEGLNAASRSCCT